MSWGQTLLAMFLLWCSARNTAPIGMPSTNPVGGRQVSRYCRLLIRAANCGCSGGQSCGRNRRGRSRRVATSTGCCDDTGCGGSTCDCDDGNEFCRDPTCSCRCRSQSVRLANDGARLHSLRSDVYYDLITPCDGVRLQSFGFCLPFRVSVSNQGFGAVWKNATWSTVWEGKQHHRTRNRLSIFVFHLNDWFASGALANVIDSSVSFQDDDPQL